METVSNTEDVASEIEAAAFRQATIEHLPIGLADDHETSDLLCQAVERQKAEEVVSVSAVAETRTLRRGAHDGQLTGAVLVAFAQDSAFSGKCPLIGSHAEWRRSPFRHRNRTVSCRPI